MSDTSQSTNHHLPPGMDKQAFTEAVSGSGYPMQMEAADALKRRNFWVQEEWAYTDAELNQRRALDISAGRMNESVKSDAGESAVSLELLIECKRSRNPYIFFQAINPPPQRDHPRFVYNPGQVTIRPDSETSSPWTADISLGVALDLPRLPFLASVPVASTMSVARANGSRVVMSGDEAYRELLLPLTKAAREHRAIRLKQRNNVGAAQFVDVPFPVALLDAPMFLVRAPGSSPESVDWVRIFVRPPVDPSVHAWRNPTIQFVEIIHRSAFETFLDDHLATFAAAIHERIAQHHEIVLGEHARVRGLERGEVLDGGVMDRLLPG